MQVETLKCFLFWLLATFFSCCLRNHPITRRPGIPNDRSLNARKRRRARATERRTAALGELEALASRVTDCDASPALMPPRGYTIVTEACDLHKLLAGNVTLFKT